MKRHIGYEIDRNKDHKIGNLFFYGLFTNCSHSNKQTRKNDFRTVLHRIYVDIIFTKDYYDNVIRRLDIR